MKSYNKNKKSSHSIPEDLASKKDSDNLNEHEKKSHNKPMNTGNHIEKKWFPNERK